MNSKWIKELNVDLSVQDFEHNLWEWQKQAKRGQQNVIIYCISAIYIKKAFINPVESTFTFKHFKIDIM